MAGMRQEVQPALHFAGRTPSEYETWRTQFAAQYHQLLGPFPNPVPLRPEVLRRIEYPRYVLEKVVIDAEQYASIPCWVASPTMPSPRGQYPAVLCAHGHGAGKQGMVGVDGAGNPVPMDAHKNLAVRLAEAGFIAIAPDWRTFGERTVPPEERLYTRDPCDVAFTNVGQYGYHLLTLDIWDGMRVVDYLLTRPEVDARRIGVVGLSFGGTMSLHLAAADERIAACCISGYLAKATALHPWNMCGSQTLSGLLNWGDRSDIAGLICPRPLLVQIGEYDATFPATTALEAYAHLRTIYQAAGHADQLACDLFDGCHEIHVSAVIDWFTRWLKTA
jgi:dienelactone hydrolase